MSCRHINLRPYTAAETWIRLCRHHSDALLEANAELERQR